MVVSPVIMRSVQVRFDFYFLPSNAVRLIPMHLRLSHSTIAVLHSCLAFVLTPVSASVLGLQPC